MFNFHRFSPKLPNFKQHDSIRHPLPALQSAIPPTDLACGNSWRSGGETEFVVVVASVEEGKEV